MSSLSSTITITTSEYRPCYVDGKKALFHKWEFKTIPILKFGCLMNDTDINEIIAKWKERGYACDETADIMFQTLDLGIVEYEDGTVAEVEPSKIRFVPGIMDEYSFDEPKRSDEAEHNAECAKTLHGLTSCNDCEFNCNPLKNCKCAPEFGKQVRYNCPNYEPYNE